MKTFFILLTLTLNLFSAQLITLYGDRDYPPYSYEQDGKAKGVYVDIIRAAFKKMPQYNVEFKMLAWKRDIAMVKSGKAVGFFPPYYSKERIKWTHFSQALLEESSNVYAKEKTLRGRKKFPADYYGTTVCLNRGWTLLTGGLKFKNAVETKKIKKIEANNSNDCLARVKRGLADFSISDQFIDISHFPSIKRGSKAGSNFGYIGFTLKGENYPYLKELEQNLDATIEKMKKSGTIAAIMQKYK